jgi:uncharacterized SAM-binding protein YcdF (DUF218 family)
VPSANWQEFAPEFGGRSVGEMTLGRLRYAARLHRLTGAPILVTGGPDSNGPNGSIAAHMARTLIEEFGVPVRFVEGRASDTHDSAVYASRMLREAGIDSAYLVTHAWHMPRARLAFDQVGFRIVPAAMGFTGVPSLQTAAFLPTIQGVSRSFYFFHEVVGYLYYRTVR